MTFSESFGDEVVDLPALSTKEYEQIESTVRANRRAELTGYLTECKITGAERFVALRDARPDSVTIAQVWSYLETLDGARKAIRLSLIKVGKSEEQANALIERLDFPDAVNLALALIRFAERREKPAKDGTKDESPLGKQPPSSASA